MEGVDAGSERLNQRKGARNGAGVNGNGLCLPSRQSLHINSFRVYTLMLYGSLASTCTLRFFKYFSSILYGCRAPVVSNNVIMHTGPSELSGFAAGVSVEGPIAWDSLRFKVVGGAGFGEGGETGETWTSCVSFVSWSSRGLDSGIDGGCGAVSGDIAVVFAVDAFSGEGVNVAISRGLVGRGVFSLLGREGVVCVALCAGAPDADEAMAHAPGVEVVNATGKIDAGGRKTLGKKGIVGESGSINTIRGGEGSLKGEIAERGCNSCEWVNGWRFGWSEDGCWVMMMMNGLWCCMERGTGHGRSATLGLSWATVLPLPGGSPSLFLHRDHNSGRRPAEAKE